MRGRLRRLIHALKARAWDGYYHPLLATLLSCACLLTSILVRPLLRRASFSLLCRAHRLLLVTRPGSPFPVCLNTIVERSLRKACKAGGLADSFAAAPIVARGSDRARLATAGLVLKAVRCDGDRVVEKGVLLLKNIERFDLFRRCVDMAALLQRYALVLEPSWSAYAHPLVLAFCAHREHPVLVMAPWLDDYRFLERLDSSLRPIPIGGSDWVDPRVFRPLAGREKRYDAVMIARWTVRKRHHLLFRALRRIGDPSFRVALVASTSITGPDRDAILATVDAQGLAGRITVFEDLPHAEVNEILNQSKVNLVLSRQEGSNRSLFEGFFAGVPGLAFANHLGIPKAHFNAQTGRLIAEHELADALLHFREHASEYDPRPWALATIAPEVTTAKLNAALKALAEARREPWTCDIVAKCNSSDPRYYPDASVGQGFPAIGELLAQFPRNPRTDAVAS
jgi:glycosyltransferase involved in cell wall biosynthesis